MRSFVWVDMDVGGDNAEEIISHTAECSHLTRRNCNYNAPVHCVLDTSTPVCRTQHTSVTVYCTVHGAHCHTGTLVHLFYSLALTGAVSAVFQMIFQCRAIWMVPFEAYLQLHLISIQCIARIGRLTLLSFCPPFPCTFDSNLYVSNWTGASVAKWWT